MKNLLHHIQILVMLALLMAIHSSCSNEWQDVSDVQVNFTATLPVGIHTRSFGKAERINTLVAGVFNGLKEVSRQSFAVNGTSIDIQLTLPKNQTYNFVFWAYNSSQNIYNIANLTAIKMNEVAFSKDIFLAAYKLGGDLRAFHAVGSSNENFIDRRVVVNYLFIVVAWKGHAVGFGQLAKECGQRIFRVGGKIVVVDDHVVAHAVRDDRYGSGWLGFDAFRRF